MLFKITETPEAITVERAEDPLAGYRTAKQEWEAGGRQGEPPQEPESHPDSGIYYVRKIEDVALLPNRVAVAAYNRCFNVAITKFRNRQSRLEKVWEALQSLSSPNNHQTPEGDPGNMARKTATKEKATKRANKKANGATKAERKPREFKEIEPVKSKDKLKQARAGSKVATLIDLLSQEGGTTVKEIETKLSKTGRPINARSWLNHSLRVVHGYGVKTRNVEGEARLFLWLPEDTRKPLPHKSSEEE